MTNQHIELVGHGDTDQLQLRDGVVPEPGPGQLLLRVHTAGVAFADVMQRHGQYPGAPPLPYTPGYDVVGVVERGGSETQLEPGTRVAALTRFDGYAQYVCVEEAGVVEVPESIPSADAVCLVLNFVSAYQMLTDVAQLGRGDSVLVHSAAGGVGTAAVQLGGALGLRCFGTASASKCELVTALGATAIDYRRQDFVSVVRDAVPGGLDAVLDPIGPDSWKRSKACLRRGGTLVAYGGLAMLDTERDDFVGNTLSFVARGIAGSLLSFGVKFKFFSVSAKDPERTRRDLKAVFELVQKHSIKPVISEVLPLAQAARAHALLASRRVRGKLVLDCG